MITKRVGRWLDSRLHLAGFVRESLNHVFPDHWSFMLGEIALYCFIVLVLTGTYLAMFFHASSQHMIYHGSYRALDGVRMSDAYQSALHISFDVRAGLLVRQMHHWAADIFIWAILAHLARIFFTAAYRKPREINWVIGVTLLILALVNGFLGYSILDDLLSGIGLRIGYAILLSVPVIGPWLALLGLGGNVPNPMAIPRLYSLHIFLVPGLIAVLLVVHLGIIWRQLHTNYPGPKRTNRTIVGSRLWPSYTAKSLGLLFLVFGVIAALGGLVQIDPVWINGPYNPAAAMTAAQPDWYLGWVEGAIRLFPGVNFYIGRWLVPELFFPAALMPGLLFSALYAYPFIEKLFSNDKGNQNVLRFPWQQPLNTAIGCGALAFIMVLLAAGGDDVIASEADRSLVTIRAILRILVFIVPLIAAGVAYALCIRAQGRDLASRQVISHETVVPIEALNSELTNEAPSAEYTELVQGSDPPAQSRDH